MFRRSHNSVQKIVFLLSLSLGLSCWGAVETSKKAAQDRVDEFLSLAREAQRVGLVSKAITNYQKVIGLGPTNGDAWLELGNLQDQKGNFKEALYSYRKAIELIPNSSTIHHKIGLCLQKSNNGTEACNHFETAIRLKPDFSSCYLSLYELLKKQGKDSEALEVLQRGIIEVPDDAILNHMAGMHYRDQNQVEKAVEYLRNAIKDEQSNITFLQDLANTLCMVNQYDEALLLYQKIFEMDTSLIGALYNIGYVLKRQGHINEAIQVLEKVIEITPDNAQAHLALGMAYLSRGASDSEWSHGWLEYEWRWSAYQTPKKQFKDKPFWDGSDLKEKTILVLAEQGFGDTFQFIRYAKILKGMGARVIFICPSALKQFLKSSCDYIDEVLCAGDSLPSFDCQIHLLSLPRLLNTTEKTVPADIPYLKADPKLIEYWREKLSSDKNFKIGLCWQGNANYSTQSLRAVVAAKSLSIKLLMSTLSKVPGCSFYSLQKMGGVEQVQELQEMTIHDFADELDGVHGRFMDSAAIMMNLDLVITIDTSIAHLSAGLGIPTWILLPTPADWRWMMKRLDTPWYPKVKLFRQPAMGDWNGLLTTLEDSLEEIVSSRKVKKTLGLTLKETPDIVEQNNSECITQRQELLNLPIAEFLDQIALLALKNGSDFTSNFLCEKEQEELLGRYHSTIDLHPELKTLAQGLFAANCYLVASMNALSTDAATMRAADVETQIADLNRAQKLKRLLKDKIAQIIQ